MSSLSSDRLVIADDMAHSYNSDLDAFDLYHRYKHQKDSSPSAGSGLPALGHAVAGSIGTAASNLAIYPLTLIITRLQVQRTLGTSSNSPNDNYEGVIDAAQKIYKSEGGIKAFYSGVIQDTGKSIADSFLFFLFYETMRENRLKKRGPSATALPVFDELAVGALAGAFAKLFTSPISNIVTRKQTAAMRAARSGSHSKEMTTADIIKQIRDEKGWQGFWSGYSAQLVLTLNPSITFFLYETFKKLLPQARREDPGARLTFLLAASSKAIASAITYPFSLAKARAQSSAKAPVDSNAAKDIKAEAENAAHEKNTAKAKSAGQHAKVTAKRSTVFTEILKIYREEGPGALYEGVFGEMVKGFLSHGTTMLIKEAIHKFVIQLYMLILRALNKVPVPSPAAVREKAGEVVSQAGEVASDTYAKVGETASGVYEKAGELVGQAGNTASGVYEKAGEVASQAGSAAGNTASGASSKAGELAGQASNTASGAYSKVAETAGSLAQNVTGSAKEVVSRAQVVGSNAVETAKSGGNASGSKASGFLGKVQEKAGNSLVDAGKAIKRGDEK